MKTRTLPRGSVEFYNALLRIRLPASPGMSHTTITVFFLKPNGYYYRKVTVQVQCPVDLQEVFDTYEALVQAA